MRKLYYIGFIVLAIVFGGCATASSNIYNIDNNSINKLSASSGGTYSDYDKNVEYSSNDKLYHYIVYVGGLGSCDSAAIIYAKKKLDKFMHNNNFKSYKIVKGDYILMPMSKCDLSVEFKK